MHAFDSPEPCFWCYPQICSKCVDVRHGIASPTISFARFFITLRHGIASLECVLFTRQVCGWKKNKTHEYTNVHLLDEENIMHIESKPVWGLRFVSWLSATDVDVQLSLPLVCAGHFGCLRSVLNAPSSGGAEESRGLLSRNIIMMVQLNSAQLQVVSSFADRKY